MATEGPISTLEHISNEQNGLQESANADSHIPDINDASALHKAADDAQETGSQDTVSRSASEEIARTSIDSAAVSVSSSRERYTVPILMRCAGEDPIAAPL